MPWGHLTPLQRFQQKPLVGSGCNLTGRHSERHARHKCTTNSDSTRWPFHCTYRLLSEPPQPFISFLSTSPWPVNAHSSLLAARKYPLALTSHSCFNPALSPQSQNLLPVLPGNPSMVHPSVPMHKSLIHLSSLCAQWLLVVVFIFPTPPNSTHTYTRTQACAHIHAQTLPLKHLFQSG